MKNKLRSIAFSALITLGAFSAITYTACTKDECKNVVCQNGGICNSGTCTGCNVGYQGSLCETASASLVVKGAYSATETCQPPVTGGSWSSDVQASSADATRIVITNFGDSGASVTAQVNQNAISIDPTTLGNTTVTGNGTINGNVITINYTLDGPLTDYSCTMTMNKL